MKVTFHVDFALCIMYCVLCIMLSTYRNIFSCYTNPNNLYVLELFNEEVFDMFKNSVHRT